MVNSNFKSFCSLNVRAAQRHRVTYIFFFNRFRGQLAQVSLILLVLHLLLCLLLVLLLLVLLLLERHQISVDKSLMVPVSNFILQNMV
jgi:hypothetical protein